MSIQSKTSPPGNTLAKALPILNLNEPHTFIKPTKRIHEGQDVNRFLSSRAYTDIGTFVMQLNTAMCPRKPTSQGLSSSPQTWVLGDPAINVTPPVQRLGGMLDRIGTFIDEAPPETGPRRFGNVAFRKWFAILEERVEGLLEEGLPDEVLRVGKGEEVTAKSELCAYLLGAWGSPQRLDYGTGHELSFLAFLGCVWKLGGFPGGNGDGDMERSIVIGIVEPYLRVVRKLILTYTLEPAGSHGVWGLDDHSFLPYVFGSAQYCPPIGDGENMPIEGSLTNAPNPADVAKKNVVDRERKTNMYFAAVGFIYDVKTGPFWEHSPILFDISGIRSGWGKINKGMIKMYNAEVLSKFPVIQHFPFGSLFSWEEDPNAPTPTTSTHVASQPSSHTVSVTGDTGGVPQTRQLPQQVTKAPWSSQSSTSGTIPTAAPWVKQPSASNLPQAQAMPPTRAPWAAGSTAGAGTGNLPTRAPHAQHQVIPQTKAPWASAAPPIPNVGDGPTRAPWAQPPDGS